MYVDIYIYIILAQTYLQKNATVKFLRGGSCKTMVFYSSSRVPPEKNPLPYLFSPYAGRAHAQTTQLGKWM